MKLPIIVTIAAFTAGIALAEDQQTLQTTTSQQGQAGYQTAGQAGQSGQHVAQNDRQFIQKAAKGGKMELEMGRMGTQKASDPQVKQFAQRLVDDHTKANQELMQIAQQLGVQTDDKSMKHDKNKADRGDKSDAYDANKNKGDAHASNKDHDKAGNPMKKMESLSGSQFDEQFIRTALKHHRKDVSEFEKASRELQNPQLKAFAAKTLPVLQQHLQTAQQLAQSRNITITEASGAEAEYDADVSTDSAEPSNSGATPGESSTSIQEPSGAATSSDTDISADASVNTESDLSTDQSQPVEQPDAAVSAEAAIDEPSGASTESSSTSIESSNTSSDSSSQSNELPSGLNSSNPDDLQRDGTSSRPSEPQRVQQSDTSSNP